MYKARRGVAIIVVELETDLIWDCILYFVHIKLLSEVVVMKDEQNYEIIRQIDNKIVLIQMVIHFSVAMMLPTSRVLVFPSLMFVSFCFFLRHSRVRAT